MLDRERLSVDLECACRREVMDLLSFDDVGLLREFEECLVSSRDSESGLRIRMPGGSLDLSRSSFVGASLTVLVKNLNFGFLNPSASYVVEVEVVGRSSWEVSSRGCSPEVLPERSDWSLSSDWGA